MSNDFNMIGRGHSWRGWEPAELRTVAKQGGEADVREVLQFIESGRFYPMLKATHRMYVHLDPDERQEFWRRNPDLMRWVNVYEIAERQGPVTNHKPKDVPLEPDRE